MATPSESPIEEVVYEIEPSRVPKPIPVALEDLCRLTKFTRQEIRIMYRGFKTVSLRWPHTCQYSQINRIQLLIHMQMQYSHTRPGILQPFRRHLNLKGSAACKEELLFKFRVITWGDWHFRSVLCRNWVLEVCGGYINLFIPRVDFALHDLIISALYLWYGRVPN